MHKSRSNGLIQAIFVVAAIMTIIGVLWQLGLLNNLPSVLGNTNTGASCTITPPTKPFGLMFYKQGDVFCINPGQTIQENISIVSGDSVSGMSINGSYTSSGNIQLYVLNSFQYGQFTEALATKGKISNDTWYSGNNQGRVINATNLAAGDTYYLVFYDNSSSVDTITIQSSIDGTYTYGYG